MMRILAHKITFEGRNYPLSIVEISDDHRHAIITPFEQETPNTTWVDGCVELICVDGYYTIKHHGHEG